MSHHGQNGGRGACHRRGLTRRGFLGTTAAALGGFLITHGEARRYAANERLDLALIGPGGRGRWFVSAIPNLGERLVAFCEVDVPRAGPALEDHPDVPLYHDFRRMLDEKATDIDGVIVATPDHTHAPASAAAIRAGKPVLCEKPLTHTVHEARVLAELAAEHGVATQMGNQGTASEGFRRAVELVRAGVIGEVRQVYAWNTGANGRRERPHDTPDIPDHVHWDLWLGPAPHRPYHPTYLRGRWHSWVDFGTGTLGNWGCHMLNLPFKALRIGELWNGDAAPIEVAADHEGFAGETHPRWLKVTYRIPSRGRHPPLELIWGNGTNAHLERMGLRETVQQRLDRRLDWGDAGDGEWADWAGVLLIGGKGMIYANAHNTQFELLPADRFDESDLPGPTLPRSPGHEAEWLRAIRTGGPTMSSFSDHASPLTELVLLGNVAYRAEEPIEYDPAGGRVTNGDEADGLLRRDYREGWSL